MTRGHLFVISAPSGTGKTTVIDRLLADNPTMKRCVTCTTRPPRSGELHGRDYFFLSDDEFNAMVQAKAFLEWAEVHGYHYGTPQRWCEDQLVAGYDIILNIDVQGGTHVKLLFPEAVLIFLSPPSLQVLEERLRSRGTNAAADIARRIQDAKFELSVKSSYDYEVVNDVLVKTVQDIENLVKSVKERA